VSTDTAPAAPASSVPRRAGAFLPLLRAELSRVSHRRLFWICSSLLLAGIVVVSGIIFFHSAKPGPIPADVQQAYEQDLARQQRFYDRCVSQNVPEGEDPIQYCGEPPEEYMSVYNYTNESPYRAEEALLPVVVAISIGSAMLAFLIGASTGGAEWSSRSMTLQLLWEPRRLRLLLTKWLALAVVMTLTALVNLAVGLGLGAATASLRGTWDGVPEGFWPELLGVAARGAVLIVFAATVAYAISMLVRNTGGSLGVGFVYFAVAELGIRLGLGKYGPDVYLLSTNVGAWLVPGGIDVPGKQTDLPDGSIMIEQVHLSNLHGLVVMSAYLLVLALPALWSFRRRDVS
jgi:hypothetical protein